MSNNKSRTQGQRTNQGSNNVTTKKVTSEDTQEQPTTLQPHEAVIESEVTEVDSEVETAEVKTLTTKELEQQEQLTLAKELNLTIRTDVNSGQLVLPSTPAMRRAAAAKRNTVVVPDTSMDIEAHVVKQYGEAVITDPNIKLVISTLATYVKRMSPSASINEEDGGEFQAKLANLYDVVLSLNPELAQVSLEIIVSVIKQNLQGAFTPRSALRFANTMPVDKTRAIRFQLLTTLFMSMASGTTKKNLSKTINIQQLLEYVTERTAKANISEFIN